MEPLHTGSDDVRDVVNCGMAETPLMPYRETVSQQQFELPLTHTIEPRSKVSAKNANAPDDAGYRERQSLFEKYRDKLAINTELSRALVSFQANKTQPIYRWFKYKARRLGWPHQAQRLNQIIEINYKEP
jgi:hypothetical protein